MRFIRTTNNIAEFIETNDSTGQIISSMGFQFGELYYQIKNGKVTFYLNDQENPFRNDIWSINIPFIMDGVEYATEDEASAHLYAVFNDRFQEQLDELRNDLEEEIGRSIATDEALSGAIHTEMERAISAETHLQDEITELSGTVAQHEVRITRNEVEISALTTNLTNEIIRATNKDQEHDDLISGLTDDVADLYETKQNKLIAGKYISISGDVISADSNHVYRLTQAAYDALPEIDLEGLYIITDAPDVDLSDYTPLSAFTAEVQRSTQKDIEHDNLISGLTTGLTAEISNRQAADTLLQTNLNNEIARATSAETELHNEIISERDRALAAESGITANLNAEIQNRIADVDAEEARALAAESALTSALNAEIARSTSADSLFEGELYSLNNDITDETNNRIAGDTLLQTNLTNEVNRATSAETVLHNEILAEETRALAAESGITANLNAEIQNRIADVDAEETRALAAESAITLSLSNEIARATSAETSLNSLKADKSDVYTKAECDNKYTTKEYMSGFSANYYDKNATDALLANKQDVSGMTAYTTTATTNALNTVVTAHTADIIAHTTQAEKNAWNAKSDFSGSYNDLTDKPTIPTVPTSNTAFTNDAGYITSAYTYSKAEIDEMALSGGSGITSAQCQTMIDNSISGKQDTLTAGTGIDITNNVISATGGSAEYSAGTNVQIVNNVISATDTTYTAGDGINISNSNVISTVTKFECLTEAQWAQISGGTLDANTVYMIH